MATYLIDYFEIPARDAPKTSTFFTQAFGFGSLAYGPDYVEVREADASNLPFEDAESWRDFDAWRRWTEVASRRFRSRATDSTASAWSSALMTIRSLRSPNCRSRMR